MEIKENFFTFSPGLSADLVQKCLNKKQATILGHLKQARKGPKSTQKKEHQSNTQPKPEPKQFTPSANSVRTNLVLLKTVYLTA